MLGMSLQRLVQILSELHPETRRAFIQKWVELAFEDPQDMETPCVRCFILERYLAACERHNSAYEGWLVKARN